MRRTKSILVLARVADVLAAPLTYVSGYWMKVLRTLGLEHMPVSRRVLIAIGVMPLRDHYNEPMINPGHLRYPLSDERKLPGINLNVTEQLSVLSKFAYRQELLQFPLTKGEHLQFYYHNGSFASGDAEYLYSMVRLYKPKKIIEIGCGASTLMMRHAINRNALDNPSYRCEHICIEPYEQPWLEELGIQVIRHRVEECDMSLFTTLDRNDLLFIDSSHVIRPQGDVLFEYLEVLPTLKSGVLVHIHDIFTPRDYLHEWVIVRAKLWNEQYLLEGFLSFNKEFRVLGAVNFLKNRYPNILGECFPILQSEMSSREPGSFWLVRQ
jgi:predicted O-methyltransferase YrrM